MDTEIVIMVENNVVYSLYSHKIEGYSAVVVFLVPKLE